MGSMPLARAIAKGCSEAAYLTDLTYDSDALLEYSVALVQMLSPILFHGVNFLSFLFCVFATLMLPIVEKAPCFFSSFDHLHQLFCLTAACGIICWG